MRIVEKIPIEKGWSEDRKYRITDETGARFLLRVSPAERGAARAAQFERMARVASLGIPMCAPVEFGTSAEGAYSIQTWIDGEDAETRIPMMTESRQYAFGLRAGEILRTIHSIPAPEGCEAWDARMGRKLDRKIALYRESGLCFEGAEEMIRFIAENRRLIAGRPQCYQHGDYHIGNMMIAKGELIIIDFDRDDWGDPWEEFNRIVWCAKKSPMFASGMVNGYFGGTPPEEFWRLLALYIASNTLSSVPWAIPFGQGEVDVMLGQAKDVLTWYDGMRRVVPAWYFAGFQLQWVDGIPIRMKAAFDFSFLAEYGRVFAAFDDQDSGNICFGAEKDGARVFVKFAGAPTAGYDGVPGDAVARLKAAEPIYRALAHPALARLIAAREVGGGYALVFEWADGDCMGRAYPEAHARFMALPSADRIAAFREILAFHLHIAESGWVAIDFYDGSVLYDFATGKSTICDIDCYAKRPYCNRMGRLWGSRRFMSPEEFSLGAEIDEITNVYTMGAMAFALFADYARDTAHWTLSDAAFEVASRAVSDDRAARQGSIRAFMKEWEDALA